MSAEAAPSPVSRHVAALGRDRSWSGMLCVDTAQGITDRMNRMLSGRRYTFVVGNSYSDESELFRDVEVRTSNRLVEPIKVAISDEGWVSVTAHDENFVWGMHTSAQSEQEGRSGSKLQWVRVSFDNDYKGERIVIEHYAPARYRLHWVIALERTADALDAEAVAS